MDDAIPSTSKCDVPVSKSGKTLSASSAKIKKKNNPTLNNKVDVVSKPKKQKKSKDKNKSETKSDEKLEVTNCTEFEFEKIIKEEECLGQFSNQCKDLCWIIIDEISLEGLDGITLEALWTRLSQTISKPLPFQKSLEQFVWQYICSHNGIQFYQLPTPRAKLVLPTHLHGTEEDYRLEEMLVDDIYPYKAVNDKANDVRGSCSTYDTRKNITAEVQKMCLEDVYQKYGNSLVLVANQFLRNKALLSEYTSPFIDLNDIQYNILERVGRARRYGELTCGEQSLINLCRDAKTLFYYCKKLSKHQLICKQQTYVKKLNKFNTRGNIVCLKRFFNERKTRKQIIIEQIIKTLLTRPNYQMEYMELKRMNILYRQMYPDAVISEWKCKNSSKEKTVRVLQLINPNVNVNSLWKEEDVRESSSDDEPIDEFAYDSPICIQSYNYIYKCGEQGISMKELQSKLGVDFYMARAVIQALTHKNYIFSKMVDAGRQRYSKYYVKDKKIEAEPSKVSKLKFNIEEPSEEDALDFIAQTLKIDPSHLKNQKEIVDKMPPPPPPSPPPPIKHPEIYGKYDTIKQIRCEKRVTENKEKLMNNSSESVPTENNDKEVLNEIYSNQHGYIDYHTSLNQKLIRRYKNNWCGGTEGSFKNLVSGIFTTTTTTTTQPILHNLYPDKISCNESNNPNFEVKEEKIAEKKEVRKFSCYLDRLYIKEPSIIAKAYRTYMQQLKSIMAKIVSEAEDPNKNIPDAILSSDDEDCSCESIDVNLGDEERVSYKNKGDEEVKKIIIENFEECEKLSNKLAVEVDEILTNPNSRKRSNSDEIAVVPPKIAKLETTEVKEDKFANIRMEIFMGPNPRCIYENVDDDGVTTRLIISSDPEDFKGVKSLMLTERVQMRCNAIKEAVDKHKMITDLCKIHQMIIKNEKKQGYTVEADRKSLFRIYTKLTRDNEVKMVKIVAQYENVMRTKNMIVSPNADVLSLLQTTIDHFKMSFFIYAKRKVGQREKKEAALKKEVVEPQEKNKVVEEAPDTKHTIKYKYNKNQGRLYGYCPKMMRMRVLHEFLFYMLYEYNGELVPSDEVTKIYAQHCNDDESLSSDCTNLYQKEISWKSFIPPLPTHKNWSVGWVLISDALLRLPLSIFVKIFNIIYNIPELTKLYLNHPIRKHILVKNLPPDIRDAILQYRKYIFSIHEILCHLCYIGILQFGPQKFREKDQVFIFLNRNAILYDTSSTEPGYHHITKKEYPKLTYNFASMTDVEKYWNDMFCISMKTKLGQRASVLGKYIALENIHRKDSMLQALKPRNPQTALERDVGYLPGDGLGACGTDSAQWLHIKRNWLWGSQSKIDLQTPTRQTLSGLRKKHMEDIKPIKFSEFIKQNKIKAKLKVNQTGQTNIRQLKKKKLATITNLAYKAKAVLRKVKPRKQMPKRVRIDQIDRNILEEMGKSRATFCEEEDKLILICKAVGEYLCPNHRKRAVGHSTVRDFIHRILPYSRKTSHAYKRRYVQLKKSDNLHDKKQPLDFNLTSDYFTQRHFKEIREKLIDAQGGISEIETSLAFLYLAYHTYQRYKKSLQNNRGLEMEYKDYLTADNLQKYEKNLPVFNLNDDENIYLHHVSEEDVILDTIKSVIHSSLGTQTNTKEFPHHLLKIYQGFSENLLRSALNLMRDQQLISGKKATSKHSPGTREGSILMCGFSYHLSFAYTFKQITKYPIYIFNEVHELLIGLQKKIDSAKTIGISIENFEQGHGVGLSEIATCWGVSYAFDLPDDIISLDPSVEDHQDLIKELALRYKTLIYKRNQDNDVDENLPEDPDISKRLEAVVENVIKSHNNKREGEMEVDDLSDIFNPEDERFLPRPASSEDTFGINSDRRQKGVRISDLAFLLTKGLFPELDDEDRLEKLNKHFVVKYPTCKFVVDERKSRINIFEVCKQDVVNKAENCTLLAESMYIIRCDIPREDEISKAVISIGGNLDDLVLVSKILRFVYSKSQLGATSEELKAQFSNEISNLTLDDILKALINVQIILRMGIVKFAFVHYSFRHNWTISLNKSKNPIYENDETTGYRIAITPWMKVNGTIHKINLYNWLNIILSHCSSYPFVPFLALCKRFCYVKPVDIYKLLEILQELNCLQIKSYTDIKEVSLFTEPTEVSSVPAKLLDNFNDLFVETDRLAMSKFGSFLNKDKTSYEIPF